MPYIANGCLTVICNCFVSFFVEIKEWGHFYTLPRSQKLHTAPVPGHCILVVQ